MRPCVHADSRGRRYHRVVREELLQGSFRLLRAGEGRRCIRSRNAGSPGEARQPTPHLRLVPGYTRSRTALPPPRLLGSDRVRHG